MYAHDELYHFGVLGMKWGVRRYQPYSVKPRGSGKGGKELIKKINPDREIKKERAKLSKNRRNISDKELQDAITRLEKEKRLKDLTDADIHAGRRVVRMIYSDYGKKAVQMFATAAAVGVGMAAVKKLGISSEERVLDLVKMTMKKK